jgi:hypothetical protein
MLSGAIVGAALVLLVVVCEVGSGFLWQDSAAARLFYCPTCDLRYTKFEVRGAFVRVCPFGHVTKGSAGFRWTPALISACVTFILLGIGLVSTGVLR